MHSPLLARHTFATAAGNLVALASRPTEAVLSALELKREDRSSFCARKGKTGDVQCDSGRSRIAELGYPSREG
jgi:hypothetical protein